MISLISKAYANSVPSIPNPGASASPVANLPTPGQAFMMNLGMIALLVGLFWVLLIMPQQKRFKKHREMLNAMKKGDRVLTAAGFIGMVDSIDDDKDEVIVDLGGGMKVTALRSTIQSREDAKSARDRKKEEKESEKDKPRDKDKKDKK